MYEAYSDEELENDVFERYRLMAQSNIERVPEPLRTMMVVYGAHGVIGNGGFRYFFESDFSGKDPYALICESYENIELPEHAAWIRKMLNLFPGGIPHKDLRARNSYLDEVFDENGLSYNPLIGEAESYFYKDHERPYQLCIDYVRKNT